MDKHQLETLLEQVDQKLVKAFPGPEPLSAIVVGGACLLFQGVIDRPTQDVDVIIFEMLGSEETTLIFQGPVADKVRSIIKAVGRKNGLTGKYQAFLNDDCSSFLLELSRNRLPEVQLLKKYQKLHLYIPNDLQYILACKLMAGREKDRSDIRALCQRFSVETRAQAKAVVDRYFPYIMDQVLHQLPQTLKDLFDA